MLSLAQIKHVITYYYLELIQNSDRVTPTHIHRDCVFFNKSRGEICSYVYSNTKFNNIIKKLHEAKNVHQINSVPVNSLCCIENKKIPMVSAGIQFIIYGKSIDHVCVQKKYQRICYYYFKLRHFPTFVQKEIMIWLNKQPWYLPNSCCINIILKRLLQSNFCEKIHRELNEMVSVLNTV